MSRSNLIVVIDGLLPEQLDDLGKHIKNLIVPPIVTLVSTIPILSNQQLEEKQLEAKHHLATAKEILKFPAASEIIPGSNPMSAENFFREGRFDAMIKRGSNGQQAMSVKNFEAPGIQELADLMPVVKDLSEHKAFQQSYKGIFAKPQNVIAKKPSVSLESDPDTIKPKI